MGNSHDENEQDLAQILPVEVNKWKAREKDQIFNSETIFDYINGAGEVYRSYNFKKLLARRYTREGQPDIIADLFDMGSSEDAFGVFTHDLEGEKTGIGRDSVYKGGLLTFWKGRFYVSLYSEEETIQAKDTLYQLGEKISLSIKIEGKKPEMISFFPKGKIDEDRIRYFHNHLILNYHYYVSEENILFLDQKTNAALARCKGDDDEPLTILIVKYSKLEKMDKAYENFISVYMPDAVELGIVQTENSKWTFIKKIKEFIVIVFDSPSPVSAKELLAVIKERVESNE